MNRTINIVAPGRICLFGDHQDYLQLPVIACAINREVLLSAEENDNTNFYIKMPDLQSERVIPINETFEVLEEGDHFGSVLRVVQRYGCIPDSGFDIVLKSTIPINAGISSSSAVVVAWTHFLLKAFGSNHEITPEFIARLAYEAEVIEHNSPGGKMDQFTISLGQIIYIDTCEDFSYKTIGKDMAGLILGESGVAKETIELLSELRRKAQNAIAEAARYNQNFDLKKVSVDEASKLSSSISADLRPYFYATVENHSITQRALSAFEKEPFNLATIGILMNAHHEILKNILKTTVPLIDAMIEAALNAGAYGAKIVGSGGGGSIVALAPYDKKVEIVNAIKACGAKDAYEVSVAKGTHNI